MHQSQGGGCCDCGDPEAWTNGYACLLHQPRTDDEERYDKNCFVRFSLRIRITHSWKYSFAILDLMVDNLRVDLYKQVNIYFNTTTVKSIIRN